MSESRYRFYHRLLTSARWRAVRAAALSRTDGMCADCLAAGRAVGATCVHHVRPALCGGSLGEIERLALDPLNCVGLCAACHRRRHRELGKGTAAERQSRVNEQVKRFGEKFFGEVGDPGGHFLSEGEGGS